MSKIRDLPEGFEWKIKWEYDEDGDSSWLGEFSSKEPDEDFVVNRRTGELLGPYEDSYQQFVFALAQEEFPEEFTWQGRDWLLLDDEEGKEGWYHFEGRPVLKENLSTRNRWTEYEWWSPTNYSMKDVGEYSLEEVLRWVESDYERLCGLANGDWWFEGCIVKLCHEDQPDILADSSLWGIESDRDQVYTNEVEEDLMSECLNDFEGYIDDFIYSHIRVDKEDPQGSLAEVLKVRLEKMAELQKWLADVEAERTEAWLALQAQYQAEDEAKMKAADAEEARKNES